MAATVVLSSDLMIASQISGAAARHGAEVRTVSSADQLLDETDTARIILDLSLPGLDVAGIVARLRAAAAPPPQIIALGPHVHEAKLAAAAKRVVTKFFREADCILAWTSFLRLATRTIARRETKDRSWNRR